MIDEANSEDPTTVPVDGRQVPYRLAYAKWTTDWVQRLCPNAPDELLILARGRNIQVTGLLVHSCIFACV